MLKKIAGFCLLFLFSFAAFSGPENVPMITERHHPEEFIQSIQNDPQAGKKIYQQFCSTCHAKEPSIDVSAPRIGVASDWKARMEKGLNGLLAVTTVGINQMPPRGGCFECSDAQLKAAIIYMLPSTQKINQ